MVPFEGVARSERCAGPERLAPVRGRLNIVLHLTLSQKLAVFEISLESRDRSACVMSSAQFYPLSVESAKWVEYDSLEK
jgi:hypothetical protein